MLAGQIRPRAPKKAGSGRVSVGGGNPECLSPYAALKLPGSGATLLYPESARTLLLQELGGSFVEGFAQLGKSIKAGRSRQEHQHGG